MESSVLLRKLISDGNDSISVYRAYQDTINNSYTTLAEAFNQCVLDIKITEEAQYDFNYLMREAERLTTIFGEKVTRKDYRDLLEEICQRLGDKITDVCCKPVFTKPSKSEYCPFNNEALVVYCTKPMTIDSAIINDDDRESYKIVDVKIEDTPYYRVYCHSIEKL